MIPGIGIVGWQGSGKTSLIARLIPELGRRGRTVSTMKHAHASFEIDRPGKDSFVHREAGAREVLVASGQRWALIHEEPDVDRTPERLMARMEPVDIVLIEGWKGGRHKKIEVHRPALMRPLLAHNDPLIVAVAADAAVAGFDRPVLPLDDESVVAQFILDELDANQHAA